MSSFGPVTPSSCPESMNSATLAGVLGALGMLLPGLAQAERFDVTLSTALATDYDSNPALSATAATPVWRYSASPRASLTRIAGPDEWDAQAGIHLERSSNSAVSAPRQDPNLSVAWAHALPTGSFGLTGGYSEASTRNTEFQQTGLVTADGTQSSTSLSANWSRELDERGTLALNAGYTGVSYRGVSLTGYNTANAGATYNYVWDERNTPYLSLSGSHYTPDATGAGVVGSDSYNLLGGIQLTRSERLSLDLSAGLNQTRAQTSRTGWQGGVKLSYLIDDLSSVNFNLGRSTTSSGLGGFVQSDQLDMGWTRDLSEKQSMGANLSWHRSQSAGAGETRQFTLWGNRQLDDLWSLRASCQYRQSLGGSVATASGYVLDLTLSYARPDFHVF